DGVTISPYMYDDSVWGKEKEMLRTLDSRNIDVNKELTVRELKSDVLEIYQNAEEIERGSDSHVVQCWKNVGMKNAFGAPLRVGSSNIGTLWLLTDEVNLTILKGICAQISIAISNIQANEKILAYKQKLENENDYLR